MLTDEVAERFGPGLGFGCALLLEKNYGVGKDASNESRGYKTEQNIDEQCRNQGAEKERCDALGP